MKRWNKMLIVLYVIKLKNSFNHIVLLSKEVRCLLAKNKIKGTFGFIIDMITIV